MASPVVWKERGVVITTDRNKLVIGWRLMSLYIGFNWFKKFSATKYGLNTPLDK